MKNLHKEYQMHSQDFLKLLGEKSRRADSNKTIAHELSIMEWYHDGIDLIFKQYEKEILSLTLAGVTENLKFNMLVKDYDREFSKQYGLTTEPTGREWVQIKKSYKEGSTLGEIIKHFDLSKAQIIELVDKQI